MFKHRYRIVRDKYSGYEAQIKFWWNPLFWWQMSERGGYGTNTHPSVELAEDFIRQSAIYYAKRVVKEVVIDG